MKDWQGGSRATMVGSMPHRDRRKVIQFILENLPEIPVWPQLAAYPAEQMMAQYLEGLPGVRQEGDRTWIQTEGADFEQELYEFFSDYLAIEENPEIIADSRFAFGPECGRTFRHFTRAAQSIPTPEAVKGQITGPFTLLSTLKDQNKRALLYNEQFQEALPKHLAMKAIWQIQQLQQLDCPLILFLDEPGLAGYGSSAFITVSGQLVKVLLEEVAAAIHRAGALAGIHICANTDWNLVFDSSLDIINFDAYNYLEKFTLYPEPLIAFVERGGVVAWGMVPTSTDPAAQQETGESLLERWCRHMETLDLGSLSLERIARQSLFTPSCGCGTLSRSQAERTVLLTRELSRLVRNRYGLA